MSNKNVFRWWWSWESEKIERWIEAQEIQGWHLVQVKSNLLRFQFAKGSPRTIRYVFDYQHDVDEDYKQLYEDAGWEQMYAKNNWYLWRKSYLADHPEQRPEIYSDVDSIVQRNNRIKTTLLTVGLVLIPILIMNMMLQPMWQIRTTILVVYLLIFALFLYGITRLNAQNRRLQEKSTSLKQ